MPDLSFAVESGAPLPYAAVPMLVFKLRISADADVAAMALQVQIRIEPTRRRYESTEREKLYELFGPPADWGRTLHSMLWTHASVNVAGFAGSTIVELPVPCTYDFNIAATKYFAGVERGVVPLTLLFSGTLFENVPDRGLQIAQIPWEKEAAFALPVEIWQQMMELYYPNTAWLAVRRDLFEKLGRYRRAKGLVTWDQTLEQLLESMGAEVRP